MNSTYNLQQLLTHVQFTEALSNRYSDGVTCSAGCNCHPIASENIFKTVCVYLDRTQLSYSADIVVKAFEKVLVPFMTSLKNRPD